jgi:hypothetical protein
MSKVAICRVAGSVLVILIGAALAFGGIQLWQGGSQTWPDIVARDDAVRRTSSGMIVMALFLIIAGAAALVNRPWGVWAAAIGTVAVVAAAFPVNYILFGQWRLVHTGPNLVVAAIILLLLRLGRGRQARSN